MLKLKDIKKNYYVADITVEALKGINLCFRKSEFVSILGPSGCGKTTLLNIIGGLDKYSSGDLYINGISTKEYNDRDWDVYRNHRIGFIFQSYNLIPHQTVLGNVELALTISGISKAERIERAKKALDRVGLSNQYDKKPNQLSGGQCQRVAIARALVNEPEILLADEPTGALDTETSVQIMELIKEIAKDQLVIMVTHNPELAEQYSNRIVRLLDGQLVSDTNPFTEEEEAAELEELKKSTVEGSENIKKKKEKAKMSWWTSLKLSLRNLWSKKARTALVCFAGSIGIIGVSMVLAVSSGVKGYIASMQDDLLSGNPITITKTTYDMDAMLGQMGADEQLAIIDNHVNVDSIVAFMAEKLVGEEAFVVENTITPEYIRYLEDMPNDYRHCLAYDYGLNLNHNIYTEFKYDENSEGEMVSLTTLLQMYIGVLNENDFGEYSQFLQLLASTMSSSIPNEEYILSQYNLVAGDKVATEANEIMLVLNSRQSAVDLTLAQLGFYNQYDFLDLAFDFETGEVDDFKNRFSYDEIVGKTFMYYPNDVIYSKNENPLTSSMSPFTYNGYADSFNKEEGMELKVVGILQLKDNVSYGSLKSGFYYTQALEEYAIEQAKDSEILKAANENADFVFGSYGGSGAMSNAILYQYHYYDNDGNLVLTDPTTGMPLSTVLTQSFNMMSMMSSSNSGTTSFGPSARELGLATTPQMISIYPLSFEEKYLVTDYLDKWNSEDDIVLSDGTIYKATDDCRLDKKITYTDTIELLISMINTMIDIVTYALIAFTCLSLVVSCVMIAIITYVSVVERVKEIGVIRSLGGSKKDVTHLFNAETIIIGTLSGIFGIAITYILSIFANMIFDNLIGVNTIFALPFYQALIMIGVSIILTVISGLIPAASAAKKDPVVALRTE